LALWTRSKWVAQDRKRRKRQLSNGFGVSLLSFAVLSNRWAMQVKGIGSGYWRAVGTVEDLMAKAVEIGQNWLCGIGFARFFKT